jgi:uncharacterized protein YceK
MKKKIFASFFLVLLLAGCSSEKTTQSSSEEASNSSSHSTIQNTITSTTVSETKSSSNTQTVTEATETTETTNEYPYQVDLTQQPAILTFSFTGVNVPDSVTIDTNKEEVTFESASADETVLNRYQGTIATVPTKTIRVFGAADNQIREVQVNTQLTIGEALDSSESRPDQLGTMYLFINSNGGLSLAAPNYAGNVSDDQKDVMLEVVQ